MVGFFKKIFGVLFSNPPYAKLPEILSRQKNADPILKLRIFYLLKDFQKIHRKPFGMIIVLGWDDKWLDRYASVLDSNQNIFAENRFDLAQATDKEAVDVLKKIADFDGAIFINVRGQIVASGMYLENMKSKEAAKILNPQKTQDLSEAFGFKRKVHTRHLAAIAVSYRLKDTTIYAVSEEDKSLRIFENGKIIWSTIRGEI